MKCKTLVTLVLLPILIGGCAGKSTLKCVGTGPFATLAAKLCPQVAKAKSLVVGRGMDMPLEERQSGVSVVEINGRIVRAEAGLQQTFWK